MSLGPEINTLAGVQHNLHIAIIMDCTNPSFTLRMESNPSFYKMCSIQWMESWSKESMVQVGFRYVRRIDLAQPHPRFLWPHVYRTIPGTLPLPHWASKDRGFEHLRQRETKTSLRRSGISSETLLVHPRKRCTIWAGDSAEVHLLTFTHTLWLPSALYSYSNPSTRRK